MPRNSMTINILILGEKDYIPKAEYVFRNFCKILNLRPRFFYEATFQTIHIRYATHNNHQARVFIQHNPQAPLFFLHKKSYAKNDINWHQYIDENIPFLFSATGPIFTKAKRSLIINKDIIASAFYFLSAWDEYTSPVKLDVNKRFAYADSLQAQLSLDDMPVVDRYCSILARAISTSLPDFGSINVWDNDCLYALTVSHDIDYWEYWTKEYYHDFFQYNMQRLFKSPLRAIYKLGAHFIHKKLCRQNTRKATARLIKKEQEEMVDASYFVLACDNQAEKRHNYFAKYGSKICALVPNIELHASQACGFSVDQLRIERKRLFDLDIVTKGVRIHYLNMNYHTSFSIMEAAGVSYDSSLAYWENYGYRAGTSYPFYPYKLTENRPYYVLEIPLVVMDTSLFSPKAMHLSIFSALTHIKRLLTLAKKNNSHLGILWHNTVFDNISYPFWGWLFWYIIHRAKKDKAQIMSIETLFEHWKKK